MTAVADEREALIRELHEQTTRPEWRARTDLGFLLGLLDAARGERDRFRAALEQIASCDSFVPGDVVDVARTALGGLGTPQRRTAPRFVGHAPGCDCEVCVGGRGT